MECIKVFHSPGHRMPSHWGLPFHFSLECHPEDNPTIFKIQFYNRKLFTMMIYDEILDIFQCTRNTLRFSTPRIWNAIQKITPSIFKIEFYYRKFLTMKIYGETLDIFRCTRNTLSFSIPQDMECHPVPARPTNAGTSAERPVDHVAERYIKAGTGNLPVLAV